MSKTKENQKSLIPHADAAKAVHKNGLKPLMDQLLPQKGQEISTTPPTNPTTKTIAGAIGGTMASPVSFLFGEKYATQVNGRSFSPSSLNFWMNGSQPPKPGMPGGVLLEAVKAGGINPVAYGLGQTISSSMEKPELTAPITAAIGGVLQGTLDRTPKSSVKHLIPGNGLRLLALFGVNQSLDSLRQDKEPSFSWTATKSITAAAVAKPIHDAVIHVKSGNDLSSSIKKVIEAGTKGYRAGLPYRIASAATALAGCTAGQQHLTGSVSGFLQNASDTAQDFFDKKSQPEPKKQAGNELFSDKIKSSAKSQLLDPMSSWQKKTEQSSEPKRGI
jgi:hypothetical protein